MTSILTLRLPKEQREALRKRAAALQKSESELVRTLISRDLDESSILDRVGHLIGSVDSSKHTALPQPLKKRIREHNWRS